MKIAVIGAGIGGLTTAIALRKYCPQWTVELYERSEVLRAAGAGLALGANAVLGFEQLGIQTQVLAQSNILEKFQILDGKGRIISETNNISINKNLHTVSNFAIHRADLQQVLLECLGDVPIHLNKKVIDFQQTPDGVQISFADDTATRADFVIATDGIHSIFRQHLLPTSVTRFAGYTCWRGVTDSLPTDFDIRKASETWGRGKRFGIVPLTNHRIYWFACANAAQAQDPHFATFGKSEILQHFGDMHAPIADIIQLTDPQRILWNDIIDLQPIQQHAFGNILLLGDAAHATTPNMGQGACQAIEGAVILGKMLAKNTNISQVVRQFEQKRLPRVQMIVNRSWQIGKVAQLENSLLMGVRNLLLRCVPTRANEHQIKQILNVDFE